MHPLYLIIVISFLTACGSKQTTTTPFSDTLEIAGHPKDTAAIAYPLDDPAFDSMTYVGNVEYFPGTNEVFTTFLPLRVTRKWTLRYSRYHTY